MLESAPERAQVRPGPVWMRWQWRTRRRGCDSTWLALPKQRIDPSDINSSLPHQTLLAHRDIVQRVEIAISGINGPIAIVPPNFGFFRRVSVEFYKEAHGARSAPQCEGRCEQMLASCRLRRAGSFGRDRGHVLGFDELMAALAAQPLLEPVEIEVDNRCRVEREQLAQRKPAHHCIAERLPQLGAGSSSERERHAGEH